jgi:hypothetical protein
VIQWPRRRPAARRVAVYAAAGSTAPVPPAEADVLEVPSRGGWTPPPGVRPGWNWTPPGGVRPRLDRVPRWVGAWYRIPFVDRYAHHWMWQHGGWDVEPPLGE